MFIKLSFIILASALWCAVGVHAQTNLIKESSASSWLIPDYDETGRPLPPGVSKVVETNGVTIAIVPFNFTTKAYQQAALDKLIQEANLVAQEMKLPETLPITRSNLTGCYISPFDYAYSHRALGFVETANFCYYVSRGNKFSNLNITHYDQVCFALRDKGRLPISQLDTNAAYQLATQWMGSASMDVAGLNRDCRVHVEVSPFWNELEHLGDKPKDKFVPIYYIWWVSQHGGNKDSPASVELYLPEKKLLQMDVDDPKYILRPPVVFTNMAELFPGTAPIYTNRIIEPRRLPPVSDAESRPIHTNL